MVSNGPLWTSIPGHVFKDALLKVNARLAAHRVQYEIRLVDQLLLLGPPAGGQPVQLVKGTDVIGTNGREFDVRCPSAVSSEPVAHAFRARTAESAQTWQRKLLAAIHGMPLEADPPPPT